MFSAGDSEVNLYLNEESIMLEFLFGYALGGLGTTSTETVPPAILGGIYVNVGAIQKIQDPLDVQTACTGWQDFWDRAGDENNPMPGIKLRELFETIHPEDFGLYEILRITRVVSQENSSAAFWFEFIEKDKLAQ
mgnify:CR=1 FL=1